MNEQAKTTSGQRIIRGLEEAVKVAKGEQPAARIFHQGIAYVPAQAVQDERDRCAQIARLAAETKWSPDIIPHGMEEFYAAINRAAEGVAGAILAGITGECQP